MNRYFQYFKKISRRSWIIIAAAAIVMAGIAIYITTRTAPAETAPADSTRQVSVEAVALLSSDTSPLPVIGTVSSVNEANLRSESQGEVIRLNYKLGDYVGAGAVIAEMENASQRAALLQAQGGLAAAKASAEKVKGGTRDEQLATLKTNYQSAEQSLTQNKASFFNALQKAYVSADDAIHNQTDVLYSNARSSAPQLSFNGSDYQKQNDTQNKRSQLEALLATWQTSLETLSVSGDLPAAATAAQANLRTIKVYLDTLSSLVNNLNSSASLSSATISSWKLSVSTARSEIDAAIDSLNTAQDTYNGKVSALAVSKNTLDQGVAGNQSQDVAAAEANVMTAQGGYQAALANLEKTIIRSPIGGTLNNLAIKRGDFITAFQPVAIVSNNGALEIVTYITEDERKFVIVGTPVTIEETGTGIITKVAPALDPTTNKIEVRIGISDKNSQLTNGQSVRIEISRTNGKSQTTAKDPTIRLPLTAIKIQADKTVVFTVNDDGTLVGHAVITGPLTGDKITITAGVTPEMRIVTDARGLKEGQKVTVK